ncbi:MAG: membrane protein insertase YidC [Alphaproteobacteria bacterium]|nr:membrane protein insertase YidC [Alphaproteobacteria bacterium]
MNNNIFLAIIISLAIWIGFDHYFIKPNQDAMKRQQISKQIQATTGAPDAVSSAVSHELKHRDEIIEDTPRIRFSTNAILGSLNLKGARFDDAVLKGYFTEDGQNIILLSPVGSDDPHRAYYADFNWLSGDKTLRLPEASTVWTADRQEIKPGVPVRLTWNSPDRLLFERLISVDEEQMFTITDFVTNNSGKAVTLFPYGALARHGVPFDFHNSKIIQEGPIGVFNGTLEEISYEKIMDSKEGRHPYKTKGGWVGITDKYWLAALIPPQSEQLAASFAYSGTGAKKQEHGFFQADYRQNAVVIAPDTTAEVTARLFVGAKKIELLDKYSDEFSIPHFDKAIDFGWFYFLTRPFLYILTFLESATGSMALAILVFTVLLKIVTLPLSQKSYRSMAKMRELQPELKSIQERFGSDKMRQSQEIMQLYKREQVNPMSGCVPMFIQIPIFFALYKVLYVSIEMWQAPFFGWISNMAEPDPTSVFTFFGLIPITLPGFLQIGAWPVIMGFTMWLQQKLSPQPQDKTQANVFLIMPFLFTFMLAHMPAGLVIYWTWSNILGIGQQWYIIKNEERKRGIKKEPAK